MIKSLRGQGDSPIPCPNFLFQILTAQELSLRLERDKDTWHGGITINTICNLITADLWFKNIDTNLESTDIKYSIRPEIQQRQRDGMLFFAEKIKWPYLFEVHEALDAYCNDGTTKLDLATWEWMAGLIHPGFSFAPNLLFGVVQASESVVGPPRNIQLNMNESNFGIVVPHVSYWRSRSVLGRVLAPLEGVEVVAGWVGPCPVPSSIQVPKGSTLPLEIQTRPSSFPVQDSLVDDARSQEEGMTWELPQVPSAPCENYKLESIQLAANPVHPDQVRRDAPATIYQASLSFKLTSTGKFVNFALHTNPFFIATQSCGGTHRIDSRFRHLYCYDVLSIRDFEGASPTFPDRIRVINANCPGGEVVARAWCANRGVHAVVWSEGSGCCFKCALMIASNQGTGVGVLVIGVSSVSV